MAHTCPADGCQASVPDRFLMCPRDWRRVPYALKQAVLTAYANGTGLGSSELIHAQMAAINAVNGES